MVMESYIPITFLNDFIFCPRSIYFHQLYGSRDKDIYHTTDQVKGIAAHSSVEAYNYSTRKDVFQALEVFSTKYGLCGKIDIYDQEKRTLIERKKLIKVIYDGYVFQLYAQYHCLVEMGYKIEKISLYSMDTNKMYAVPLPSENPSMQSTFEELIEKINSFNLTTPFTPNPHKCRRCIYRYLCDKSAVAD